MGKMQEIGHVFTLKKNVSLKKLLNVLNKYFGKDELRVKYLFKT